MSGKKKIEFHFMAVLFLVLACGCRGQNSNCIEKLEMVKYQFVTDNQDSTKFGFRYFEDDESYSARSVALSPDGKYAYFCDAGHVNIKKLTLSTGAIQASRRFEKLLDAPPPILFDIAYLNDLVFVTTNRGIIILTKDLDYVGVQFTEFRLPSFTGFTIARNDSICVDTQFEQQQNNSIDQTVLVLIGKEPSIWRRNISIDKYRSDLKVKRRLGKQYHTVEKGKHLSIYTEFGCYTLAQGIPTLSKFFTAENLDFNSKAIVYFDAKPTSVTVYYYMLN